MFRLERAVLVCGRSALKFGLRGPKVARMRVLSHDTYYYLHGVHAFGYIGATRGVTIT